MSDYLDPNNEELLKDFFIEAQMQVDALEQNILVLENEPENQEAVDEIFRAAHTLKGGAATVQMLELAEFTHLVEDVLDGIRSEEVGISEEIINTLLASIDIIKEMLAERNEGGVYNEDISSTKQALRRFLGSENAPVIENQPEPAAPAPPSPAPAAAEEDADPESAVISEYELLEMKDAAEADQSIYKVLVYFDEDNPMNTVGGIQVFAALKSLGSVLKTIPDFELLYEDKFFPVVAYYVAAEADIDGIKEAVDMPDVITDIQVRPAGAASPPEEKPSAAGTVAAEEREKEEPAEEQTAAPEGPKEEKKKRPEQGKIQELQKSSVSSSVLRVDSRRIDTLLNLISEAVINKATFNQISSQFAESLIDFQTVGAIFKEKQRDLFDSLPDYLRRIQSGTPIKTIKKEIIETYGDIFNLFDDFEANLKTTVNSFRSTSQILGRNTTELHEKVLQIRMVPISQIFSRFPRLVRDVSKSLDKKITLQIEGEDTELDKSVIDDLLDPLIHCVRNAVDHGVEKPEERAAAGKPEEGTVLLKASNEGNMIIIEIIDDGKGIDVDVIRQKAIERGVIHPNKDLSNIEAFNLIFEPGFSTAKEITNISGRGVGLDVVKKQIDKLNGSVKVWSEKGTGTKMTIKLPLTLAIIQGLLVQVGKEVYAIPITSVLDSHRIKPADIKLIDNYEVFNVREDVISLIRLNQLFRIPSEERQGYHFIVTVGSADKKMGLMVDRLIGEEDVVIKPLKDKYTNSPGIAGATILGDGTVSLIIDVSQLLELGLQRERRQRKLRETGAR
jgi:two-component system, chemotaxis family, sensor kinase CheA